MNDTSKEPPQNLEEEKLKLEIQELKKPWWKKLSYTLIITGLAVIGSIAWTLGSGILDKRRISLDNEKTLLEIEIHEFTGQRDSLLMVMDNLQDSIQNVRDSLINKEAALITSIEQNKQLRREKFLVEQNSQGMFDYYENYIDSLIRVRTELEAEWRKITLDDGSVWNDSATWNDGKYLSTKSGVPIRTKDGKLILTK